MERSGVRTSPEISPAGDCVGLAAHRHLQWEAAAPAHEAGWRTVRCCELRLDDVDCGLPDETPRQQPLHCSLCPAVSSPGCCCSRSPAAGAWEPPLFAKEEKEVRGHDRHEGA